MKYSELFRILTREGWTVVILFFLSMAQEKWEKAWNEKLRNRLD